MPTTTRNAPAGHSHRARPAVIGPMAAAGLVAMFAMAACSPAGTSTTTTTSAATTTTAAASSAPTIAGLTSSTSAAAWSASDIRHVFVIMLENEDEQTAFGTPANDPYLASTLRKEGALLPNYYGIGHHSADNYIAFISGQPPNVDTQDDCGIFANFTTSKVVSGDIQSGDGCVYPTGIGNLPRQLTSAHFTWKAYEQDMGNISSRESAACGHPTVNQPDHTELAVAGDGYASRHDPFVYFHSVIDLKGYCDDHVVALGSPTGVMPPDALKGETGLVTDLKSAATTPNFSFITPNLCNDGHDYPCKNEASGASVWADIDRFLATWVPKIEASPAFKENGLLMITFDESEGTFTDSTACCNEQPDPGVTPSPEPGINGPGGGKIGALLISRWIRPGTLVNTAYNHYSALATFETIFGLSRLADARGAASMTGSNIFNHT